MAPSSDVLLLHHFVSCLCIPIELSESRACAWLQSRVTHLSTPISTQQEAPSPLDTDVWFSHRSLEWCQDQCTVAEEQLFLNVSLNLPIMLSHSTDTDGARSLHEAGHAPPLCLLLLLAKWMNVWTNESTPGLFLHHQKISPWLSMLHLDSRKISSRKYEN